MVQVLTILAVVYVMIGVGVMVLQRRLIYFPTKMNSVLARALAAKEGFRPWLNIDLWTARALFWNTASQKPTERPRPSGNFASRAQMVRR